MKIEQKTRFIARITDPHKNWKFSRADIHERQYWKSYTKVYEEALSATNTRQAPWYIVPADEKFNSRLIVSKIVMDTFDDMKMNYPVPTNRLRRELLSIRRELEK